jgi:outer membrane receptor for ferrienterochelin and colicins
MKRVVLCILTLAPTFGQGICATEELPATPPHDTLSVNMEDVVITATRTPLPLKKTPVITRVITARDLESRGVATIQEALENELAGVEFHQAGYGTSLSLQGLDARYVLFLVNGERMAGETYGNIDYARIPVSNIERIEIVRGASSVLYGSNAMGAVVNIITKMPQKQVEVNASLRYGTPYQDNRSETLGGSNTESDIKTYRNKLDLPNLRGDVSVGFNTGKLQSLTTLSYRKVDAYKLVGTKDEVRHYAAGELKKMGPKMIPVIGPGGSVVGMRPEMDPTTGMPVFEVKSTNLNDTTVIVSPDSRGLSVSGWRDINVGQRFDYTLSKKFRFELSGNYFNKQRYDFNGSILDDNPMSNNSKPWIYETYEGYNIKALMEHSPNENNKVYLSFIRDEYFRNLDSLSGVSTPKQNHVFNTPRLLWTLKAGESHRLTTGLELVNEQLHFDMNPLGYDDLKSMNTGSLYVQDEIRSQKALSFTAGVRADWNNRFGWHVTPKVSVKYSVGKFTIRGNYANGYRNPTLKELFMEFKVPTQGETYIMGNDALKPETNHYLSLAGEFTTQDFNISATLYNSYFRNKIDVRGHMEGLKTMLQYENIRRSQMGGIELIARWRICRGLFLRGNYNYLFQIDDASQESTQYIYPSPHTATLQADYGFSAGNNCYINFNATLRYVGAKTYEDFMPIIDLSGMSSGSMADLKYWTGSYSARQEGYVICDAAINFDFKEMVGISVGVDNIGNYRPKIVNFNSATTPRRNMFIRVSYAFATKK